jgi:hypothetical protein
MDYAPKVQVKRAGDACVAGDPAQRPLVVLLASATVEIPKAIFERVSALCVRLPEVTVRIGESRIRERSTGHSFDSRRRSFYLLVATGASSGKPAPLLVLRADPDDREALLSIGHPFRTARLARPRLCVASSPSGDRRSASPSPPRSRLAAVNTRWLSGRRSGKDDRQPQSSALTRMLATDLLTLGRRGAASGAGRDCFFRDLRPSGREQDLHTAPTTFSSTQRVLVATDPSARDRTARSVSLGMLRRV